MKKIGLIAAMPLESEQVVLWLGQSENTILLGGFEINKYFKNGCEFYFVNSGVGELLAAIATQTLIACVGVDYIINFGLCGSLCDARLGEACVVSHIIHYDFDLSSLENTRAGQYTRFDSPLIETNTELLARALRILPDLKSVICASGDKFIADKNLKSSLNRLYGAHICEMEGAGVLISALNNGTPALFIKVVSDSENNAEEFNDFITRKKFGFVEIIDKLCCSKILISGLK